MNTTIREEIHRVWDELAEFGAGESAQAVARLMAFLCGQGGDGTQSGPAVSGSTAIAMTTR